MSNFFVISKDLYLFWSSFFEDCFNWMFLPSNHMFSCFNSWVFYLFMSNYFFMASFAISIDIFATSQLLCSSSKKVPSFGNSVFIVRSLFYRCHPKSSLNEVYSVAEYFLSLYWNSATNNYFIQLSCLWLT